jgi:hypothetical protein
MRKRSTFLGALGAVASAAALATAAAPVMSSPAHAIPVLCPVTVLGGNPSNDPVRIVLPANFDFGSAGGLDSNNEPAGCGLLTWDLANGTITPRLTGSLYARNAIGTTIRMSLKHRDVDGTLLHTTNQPSKLVETDDETEFPVNLGAYNDPLIYQVDVELQQFVNNAWSTEGTASVFIGSSSKSPDAARTLATGQDFGSGNFTNGAPAGSGTLTWDLANSTITPRLTGNLYMINGKGTQARMRLSHYDVHGNLLKKMAGSTREPNNNALNTFPINLAGYSNPEIYRVEVAMQVKVGNTWTVVGTPVTVYI